MRPGAERPRPGAKPSRPGAERPQPGAERPQPRLYFDLASPLAYLAAERSHEVLGVVPEWVPVRFEVAPFRSAEEVALYREDIERRAVRYGLQPLRWPAAFPPDSEFAMLAATYAREIGRGVAFALAAFRQAFAAGRDLGDRDTALIAGAACELHPAALVKGAGLRSTRERLEGATAAARAAGVRDAPAVQVERRVFHGDRALEEARTAVAA